MSQRGNALVEFSWLAILVMVPVLWVVLAVFDVQRAAFALATAARSAGRAYVLAPSDAEGIRRASTAADIAFVDQRDDGRDVDIAVTCEPFPQACHTPTSVVTVRLSTSVALPWLPAWMGLGSPSFALSAAHTLPVGRFQESHDDAQR